MSNGYRVERAAEQGAYEVVRDCPICALPARTRVDSQALWNWEHGELAQVAFASLPAETREQLVTGTHPECWDAMMAG